MVVHVYAADCTMEAGCVAFMGKSFDSREHPNLSINVPPEPSIWSGYRTNVQKMCGVMNVISPTTAKVSFRLISLSSHLTVDCDIGQVRCQISSPTNNY